jgi:hypothetical protein
LAIPKVAAEDVVFNVTKADPDDHTTTKLHVPKGTLVVLDVPAVQYNREFI